VSERTFLANFIKSEVCDSGRRRVSEINREAVRIANFFLRDVRKPHFSSWCRSLESFTFSETADGSERELAIHPQLGQWMSSVGKLAELLDL
jgi:hypothetical protein